VKIYSRTQIRGEIWRFDRSKRAESSAAKFVEFLEELITETLAAFSSDAPPHPAFVAKVCLTSRLHVLMKPKRSTSAISVLLGFVLTDVTV
jgi:hypothetical protein